MRRPFAADNIARTLQRRCLVVRGFVQDFEDGGGIEVAVGTVIPSDFQRLAALQGCKYRIRGHGHRRVAHLHDVDHTCYFARLTVVETTDLAADHRAPRQECVLHPRHAEVDAKLSGAVGLGRGIKAVHRLANQLVLRRIFELGLFRHRQLGSALHQLAVTGAAIRCGMQNESLVGSAVGGRNAPLLCGSSYEHFASGGPGLAHRIPGCAHARASTRGLVAKQRAGTRLFDGDVGPVGIEFLGEDHGQCGANTLSHL